jgi:hypothetical protein
MEKTDEHLADSVDLVGWVERKEELRRAIGSGGFLDIQFFHF